jgi:phosphoribosylformylglycinamidine synthase
VPVYRLEIETRANLPDALGEATARRLEAWLQLKPRRVSTRKVYHLDMDISEAEARTVLDALTDSVMENGALGNLPDRRDERGDAPISLHVGFLPGVTDCVGKTVEKAIFDALGRSPSGHAYSSVLYSFWGLNRDEVERCAREVLFNGLIEKMKIYEGERGVDLTIARAGLQREPQVKEVALIGSSDAQLQKISQEGTLALTLAEMRAIEKHFAARGRNPTDAELECLAQTWSEHCKHKIFASPIRYTDSSPTASDASPRVIERGLFRSTIRAATEKVAADRKAQGLDRDGDFLVSVFHDNAGVVRFTEQDHLVYKVETHNSPSALDPYGGAMTGIVGVNRDSFGTGLGADLLTNTWGYCFGPTQYKGRLPSGLMHPRRIREGVHAGVIDGGNHSGIPYSRGFELFDERYVGKPLVYCGTVARMPVDLNGRPTETKYVGVGDAIVMVGGRIGKDGIHGATFSSVALDETSPVQAVQIGDPIIQKMMWDMLTEARDRGLYSGFTDNGAGGLSSSVGEMAGLTNGAKLDLARAPLKYPGLDPWEILISEAQERMTIAVPPDKLVAFLALAKKREVEASVIGEFTNDGRLFVTYGEKLVCDLELEFMHEGVPLPVLEAQWQVPEPIVAAKKASASEKLGDAILRILGQENQRTVEPIARTYDHEVKGLSVVKPFVGVRGDVPATATVMRVRHGRDEGVVLAEGIFPFYSHYDTRAMAQACVDESVRRILCAGGRLDRIAALDNFCWPDPVVSDKTPDGRYKLAQLVRCCEGLYEACVTLGVPLISGKDSMKNDAYFEGVKISIPPTLLVSSIGQIENVAHALTLEPRRNGDLLYVLGTTRDERGGSEWERVYATPNPQVPQTDLKRNLSRYREFVAWRDQGKIRSAHAVSRGGLAIALAHLILASERDLHLNLDAFESSALDPQALLFSESTGRLLVTIAREDRAAFESAFTEHGVYCLGSVGEKMGNKATLSLNARASELANVDVASLRRRFVGETSEQPAQ